MRLIVLFGLMCCFAIISCHKEKKIPVVAVPQKPVIILQPLDSFPADALLFLKDSIPLFYPVTVHISPKRKMPAKAYYKPRNRYRADTLIHWLRQRKPLKSRLIMGFTTKDISTTKGDAEDYGVMGLGFQPGEAGVVSTHRIYPSATSPENALRRLFKVVVHEMGHNFGLPHCPRQYCIMADADGKMKLDKERRLCDDCRKKLKI